ncbi:MAG: BON domain-containing protein [Anaerolineales bacterium]|uniref:BON domain-containing protein n=1 Tax=Candidatus Villigracilis vicinus TaxID=3140679 RepID=UPI0031351F0E|nr:BON domain-containing protein [Anaerolineales bacterium]
MFSEQLYENTSAQISRCQERILTPVHGKSLSPVEKQDEELKLDVTNALWGDAIIRSLDFYEIDIRVRNRVVTLSGHITSSRSQNRVKNALHLLPGIVEVKNFLVSDDQLVLDVASALGSLEHAYDCKFFTGASHGVVSLNGIVRDKNIRLLAERCVSENPHTRGVINNIQFMGIKQNFSDAPFLQPIIRETIYFLDWVSGTVKQVIVNPNNRRVMAMVLQGKFIRQLDGPPSMDDERTFSLERLIVIPMSAVRYLTKTSGFLYITSAERNQYMDFAPAHFVAPPYNWTPPYPYCPEDVLFSLENHENDI